MLKRIIGIAFVIMVVLFLYSAFAHGAPVGLVLQVGAIFLVFAIVVLAKGWANRAINASKEFQAHLKKLGYTYSFVGYGKTYIGFNPETRVVILGNLKEGSSAGVTLSYDQIINCKWEWLEKNGNRRNNYIVFQTNLPECSLHKIFYGIGDGWCEKEFATIQAVLSS